MAFKNIFGSAYAVVENIQYNGPRKTLTFDLVQYRSSSKEVETARSTYRVNGNLRTSEIDSVITAVPSGIEHEAMPDDFDFDVFDTFKPYLIGNGADKALENDGQNSAGYHYICEHKPQKSEATGEWPSHSEEYTEEVETDNPDYDSEKAESESNPKKITITETKTRKVFDKIKYEWQPHHQRYDCVFIDKDGDYWEVTGQPGSHTVTQINAPFLAATWDTWFSASAMDAKDKNISSQIYNWLKTRDEYKDAVKV